MPFGRLQAGCCVFYWGVASLYHKVLIGGVLQRWLSFWKVLPSPQRNFGALSEWPSGSWSPPWPRPTSPNCSVWQSFVVPNFFNLRMMLPTVCLGTFNAAEMFWYPSPDLCLDIILSRSSTDNSFNLMAWFLIWHALSTVGPFIDRCVPFQINWIYHRWTPIKL